MKATGLAKVLSALEKLGDNIQEKIDSIGREDETTVAQEKDRRKTNTMIRASKVGDQMHDGKYQQAKRIVEQIANAEPFGHDFALVDETGEWTLSDYWCPTPKGKLLVCLGVAGMADTYKNTMIHLVYKMLMGTQTRLEL